MSYIFKKAIIRKPSKNIIQAINSRGLKPIYEKVNNEHNEYIEALIKAGLEIIVLKSLKNFPDSIFVEDPAIVFNNCLVLLNSNKKSRSGEVKALELEVKNEFEKILFIKEGWIEGGDILRINNHFIIGLSERTNKKGAENLSIILRSLGASIEISSTPSNILHFKSNCSLIDNETILLTREMTKLEVFKKNYKIIEVPLGDEIAANTLRINNHLLIPKGFKKIEELLSKNYNLITLNVNEISKADAGLSCMSIRF